MATAPADSPAGGPHEDLLPFEVWWLEHSAWLEESGYALRSRYKPGWKPSWEGTRKSRYGCEDGYSMIEINLLDAVRKSDGAVVVLKKISKAVHPYEVEIGRYFSSEPLCNDKRNHCFPLLDVLQPPDNEDLAILVMPLLKQYNAPPLVTIGESIEFFRQIFEGLQFMHSHHVAHRDCMTMNIMMDPSAIYPQLFHPVSDLMNMDFSGYAKYYTRTQRPTKYYLIDFGLSRRYAADDKNPLEIPILGGDKSVPEFRENPTIPRNPFPTDVYYLGSMIRRDFMTFFTNFGFMAPLVDAMVAKDPAARPTMDEVVERFDALVSSLSWWTLRSRTRRRSDPTVVHLAKDVQHVFRTASFIVTRKRAIPTPKSPAS